MSPIHLWCRFLKQDQLTLNLLRLEISNYKLSSKMALEGNFDFNKTPLAPPGTKFRIHEKLEQEHPGTHMG